MEVRFDLSLSLSLLLGEEDEDGVCGVWRIRGIGCKRIGKEVYL